MEEKGNTWIYVSIVLAILLLLAIYALGSSYISYNNTIKTSNLYCNSLNYFLNDTSKVPAEIVNRFVSGAGYPGVFSIQLGCDIPGYDSFLRYLFSRF